MMRLHYKGAILDGDVKLSELKYDIFALEGGHPGPTLRTKQRCRIATVLCIGELLEWFLPADIQDDLSFDDQIAIATHIWRAETEWTRMRQRPQPHRGGGKQGKLPWQSTRTIQGLKLASAIAVDGVQLEELVADQVCEQAKGVALMLLSTWTDAKSVEADGPLIILFPGHCANILRKVGAAAARVHEIEIVVEVPQEKTLLRRNATALALSSHTFQFGHGLQEVQWEPKASAEYMIELDTRWASDLIAQAAESDWKALCKDLVGRMCLESVASEALYALRKSQQAPVVFAAKIRLEPGAGE